MSPSSIFAPRIFGEGWTSPQSRVMAPDGSGFASRLPLKDLGLFPLLGGGSKGFSSSADILTQTADGRDLNGMWDEFQQTLQIVNEKRTAIANMLTFPVTNTIEDVPSFTGEDFEEASQYGVPKSIRPGATVYQMGYTFKWWDIATRYTWQFLAGASANQVEAIHQSVIDADNRLLFREIMRTLFRSTNRVANINGQNYNVYTFWNGDGVAPPDYKNNTFPGSHTHFRGTGAATTQIDSGDLEEAYDDLKSHGYSQENGVQIVTFVNEAQANAIRTFKAGVANYNAAVARWDFIPSGTQPAFLITNPQAFVGSQPPSQWKGFNVVGSYGPALIIEESYIPAGYAVTLGSGGEANLQNPIGFREHATPGLRGLRLVQERQTRYPLIDSAYVRGFGTGVRQRGAAFIQQVGVAAGAYVAPSAYA